MIPPTIFAWEEKANRWLFFTVFLLADGLLSFCSLPYPSKWVVAIVGLGLPLWAACYSIKIKPIHEPFEMPTSLDPFPKWLLVLGFGLCLFLRFYRLEDLFVWITGDESWLGTLALELNHHWSWKFFTTTGEAPPLAVWSSVIMMKLGLDPFLSLWAFPSIASTLTVLVGYLAARNLFSRSFSILSASLLAFSFWPLFVGRSCHSGIWLPLWTCGCFYSLGRFWKAPSITQNREAALLGFISGLGSFIFTPWPVVMVLMGGTVLWKDRRSLLTFIPALFISLLPFLWAVIHEGFGTHLFGEASSMLHSSWVQRIRTTTDYLSLLFWGSSNPTVSYPPSLGGFLNPLLASFFFLGIPELWAQRRRPFVRWMALAFPLLLLPGLLSSSIETFRIVQVIPILLLFVAVGFASFLSLFPEDRRIFVFVSLTLISLAFDSYRLILPYSNFEARPRTFAQGKSLERYRAYKILSKRANREGPGLIFTDFDAPILSFFDDSSLSLMTFPFNAALNPKYGFVSDSFRKDPKIPRNIKWAAVFANMHYQPFLAEAFPNAQWSWVSKDLERRDGGELLGIIQVTPDNLPTFIHWLKVHEVFRQAEMERFLQNHEDLGLVIQTLAQTYPWVQGDPFLVSCYWEKRAAYEYRMGNLPEQLFSYQMAVKEGCPAGHLWRNLGELLILENRVPEARRAFSRASKAPSAVFTEGNPWPVRRTPLPIFETPVKSKRF